MNCLSTETNVIRRIILLGAILLGVFLTSLPVLAAAEYSSHTEIADSLNLPIVRWADKSRTTTGIILAIHGVTLYSETMDTTARHIAEQGYPVYGIDLRGFGKWIEQPARYNDDGKIDYKKSEEDVVRTLEALRRNHPNKPIFCLGESFGANMAIKLSATHPHLIDGVIATAPCGNLWLHPSFNWIADAVKLAIRPLGPIKLTPYIKSTLSSDPEITKAYIADPRIHHYLSLKRLIKTNLQNQSNLSDIENIPKNMPILLIAGKDDKLFKTKLLPAKLRKVGSQRVDLHILPGLGHLLLECQTQLDPRIRCLIDTWLAEQSKPTSASTDNDHSEAIVTTDAEHSPAERTTK